jgi:hypothetical protein
MLPQLKHAVRLGGGYVKYPELKLSCSQLWAEDGTHLSPLGKEVFLNTLKRLNSEVQKCTQFEVLVKLVWSGCYYWSRFPTLWRWSWLSNEFAMPRPLA